MTSSVDLSPPRRPIFFPVVIATVFLTIIGMTGGFLLGERHRQTLNAQSGQHQSGPSQAVVPATLPSAVPTVIDGTPCPDPAQKAAAGMGSGGLRQILRIETAKATVWICADPAGRLFYQSHTLLNGKDLPLTENFNGLFLPGVTRTGSGYEVYDQKRNRFEISRKLLQIYFTNGHVQSDDVDRVVE